MPSFFVLSRLIDIRALVLNHREHLIPYSFGKLEAGAVTKRNVWEALEQAHLKSTVSNLPGGLDYQVSCSCHVQRQRASERLYTVGSVVFVLQTLCTGTA
jgi:hypothetical protein